MKTRRHRSNLSVAPIALPRAGRGVECLEHRIAPAAVMSPTTFTYTDADGDVVSVRVSGLTGGAEFLDANGNDVAANGGDIAKVVITGAGRDFAITFTDTNSATGAGVGDNVITLGAISGPNEARLPVIKGIFTNDSTPDVKYQLQRFTGTDFSSGGGLSIVGGLVGDGLGATTDLDLKSVGKTAKVYFRSVEAASTVRIDGKVAGTLQIETLEGDLTVARVPGLVKIENVEGGVTLTKSLAGRLVLGDPDPLAAAATGEVTIQGSVLPTAQINATSDLVLNVTKDVMGSIITGGTLQADVGGKLKGAKLLVGNDLTLVVTGAVSGSAIVANHEILPGSAFQKGMTSSSVLGGTGLNLDITGSVATSRLSGGTANLVVAISGKLATSQLLGGGDADVTIGFGVDRSSIVPDGRLTLAIGAAPQAGTPGVGDVRASSIGSKSTSATVEVGGKVVASKFTAGTDLELTIGSSLEASTSSASNDLTLEVGTNVLSSHFAVGSDATMTVGGRISASALLVSNNLTATVGVAGLPVVTGKEIISGINRTRIETSDGSSDVTVIGPVTATVIESGQSAALHVDDLTGLDPRTNNVKILKVGNVGADVVIVAGADATVTSAGTGRVAARLASGRDVMIDVAAIFAGAISAANDVTIIAGTVRPFVPPLPTTGSSTTSTSTPPITIPGTTPGGIDGTVLLSSLAKNGMRAGGDLTLLVVDAVTAPRIDVAGNVKDFQVGGNFSGKLTVGGDFSAGGTTAAVTVIGGAVARSSFIQIGGDLGPAGSAPEFIFAKGFAGRIEVAGSLLTDLTFDGAVSRIAIVGKVGSVPAGGTGDAVADIVVRGKLGALTSATLFERSSPNGGTFVTADGTIVGALQADGGAPIVTPTMGI